MALYNYFGLNYNDVIQSFHDAIEEDFESNDKCGRTIIQNEMDLKEGELLASLSNSALAYLNELPTHEVTVANLSGSYFFTVDFIPDFNRDILIDTSPIQQQTCQGTTSTYSADDFTWTLDENTLAVTATYNNGVITEDILYLNYSINPDILNIPSLKSILRDLVCCSLGYQFYSSSDSVWGVVERYCANADKWLEKISEGWIPPEFSGLRLIEYAGRFRAIRNNRLGPQQIY